MEAALKRQKSQLLQSRQDVNRIHKELEEDSKRVSAEIETHMARQHEMRLQVAELDKQIEDSKGSIAEYGRRRKELEAKVKESQAACEDVRQRLEQRQSLHRRQQQHVMEQSIRNVPELQYLEDLLGMTMEAVKEDVLRFVFTRIDANDYSREFSFLLNTSQVDYSVDGCDPELEKSVVDKVVGSLNGSRNLAVFLKDMRRAFKDVT